MSAILLEDHGITVGDIRRNEAPALLYEEAVRHDRSAAIVCSGALAISSGAKTGRSPLDKRIVQHPASQDEIWWSEVNMPIDEHTFVINRERARDYLNTRQRLYVVDGFAGWDARYRVKVRVISERAYHALFMHNMLVRPTPEELVSFGAPDYVIFNAGRFPANRHTTFMSSKTSIDISLEHREMVILGTEYAGEMKKGIFSIMHYLMPRRQILSMHCAANEGPSGDVSLFFGLSGTGKTTLSADPRRRLIGDDEHCWTDHGIFNIEGGCYAKAIHLSAKKEPEIYEAIRFGAVLENVAYDLETHTVDYSDTRITENTRASYPIEHVNNAKIPCTGTHPSNIVFLAFDAFGVLPLVARLTVKQAMYQFLSGYTAKVAGTEMGIAGPQATFSACFGAAFLALPPPVYAELLAQKIHQHGSQVWLINSGLTVTGERVRLAHTRSIIDAIHDGILQNIPCHAHPLFDLEVPESCPGVPTEILAPRRQWESSESYTAAAQRLESLFAANYSKFAVP